MSTRRAGRRTKKKPLSVAQRVALKSLAVMTDVRGYDVSALDAAGNLLMCQQPDRHVSAMRCGYPLPCPHHTVEVKIAPCSLRYVCSLCHAHFERAAQLREHLDRAFCVDRRFFEDRSVRASELSSKKRPTRKIIV